jgi:hypothetical protein
MKLTLIEPSGPNVELRTYECAPCDSGASYLIAIQNLRGRDQDGEGELADRMRSVQQCDQNFGISTVIPTVGSMPQPHLQPSNRRR